MAGPVANASFAELTQKKFYQEFLTKNLPVVVADGCKHWKALERQGWNVNANITRIDIDLDEEHEHHKEEKEEHPPDSAAAHLAARHSRKRKHHSEGRHRRRPREEEEDDDEEEEEDDELTRLQRIGLEGYEVYNQEGMDYFQNLWITWNDDLKKYYEVPEFIFDTLHFHDVYLSFYGEESHEEKKEFAKQQKRESYFCVTHGVEVFRLVSPVFRQNMYSGVREELRRSQSPIDLFYDPLDENLEVFPLLEVMQVFEVVLAPGMCLFVPAWWWAQSRTDDGETMMTEMEFEVHSQFFDLINSGIEKEMILSQENDYQQAQERVKKQEDEKHMKARDRLAGKAR